MKNLLDIRCPKCGNTNDLHLFISGEWFDLGLYYSPEDWAKVVELWDQVDWKSPVCCDGCCQEAPLASYEGDTPKQLGRQMEAKLMGRFREAMTMDYRKK